jgi:hypothetical protein
MWVGKDARACMDACVGECMHEHMVDVVDSRRTGVCHAHHEAFLDHAAVIEGITMYLVLGIVSAT